MTASTDLPADATVDRADERQRGLTARASRLTGRGGGERDVQRVLLITGGVLLPVGLVLVLLGWVGASRTPLVFEQIPYVVSGGLLGTCLVIAGGFVYFAYWQTIGIRSSAAQHAELTDILGDMRTLLAEVAAGQRPVEQTATTTFVSTQSGTMLHRPECPMVLGRVNLRSVAADAPGLRPCSVCQPLDAEPHVGVPAQPRR